MFRRRTATGPFRPAPFPTYPADTGRLSLERWLALARWLCLLLVAIPVWAGPSSDLSLPVHYARVELDQRAPVLLSLGLPATDYAISPAGLGYFDAEKNFIYSAEVARGLIYGRRGGEVLVIEIAAPAEAELYLDQQLDGIRAQVDEVNRQKNLLRLARLDEPVVSRQAAELYEALKQELGPGLDGPLPDSWAGKVDSGNRDIAALGPELLALARHQARLKRLYYDSQAARLALMLRKYELQLALARLPQPEIDELLSLGDTELVNQTMQQAVDRLNEAWSTRYDELATLLAGDRQVLARLGQTVPGDPLATAASPLAYVTPIEEFRGPQHDTPEYSWFPEDDTVAPADDLELNQLVLEARLVINSAEEEMLSERLAELGDATRLIESQRLPEWTDLPRLAPQLKQLQLKGLEELAAFAAMEAEAREPDSAANLLLALAQAFESPAQPPADQTQAAAHHTATGLPVPAVELTPNEVAYGLLVTDRCRLGANPDVRRVDVMADLGERLEAVLEFPADFDTAAYNLGFLEFIHWYAMLDRGEGAPGLDAVPGSDVCASNGAGTGNGDALALDESGASGDTVPASESVAAGDETTDEPEDPRRPALGITSGNTDDGADADDAATAEDELAT
ncbi:hypothetical protein JW859_06755 [bacterium]|nr:hypothetical protein [bacterium]